MGPGGRIYATGILALMTFAKNWSQAAPSLNTGYLLTSAKIAIPLLLLDLKILHFTPGASHAAPNTE